MGKGSAVLKQTKKRKKGGGKRRGGRKRMKDQKRAREVIVVGHLPHVKERRGARCTQQGVLYTERRVVHSKARSSGGNGLMRDNGLDVRKIRREGGREGRME